MTPLVPAEFTMLEIGLGDGDGPPDPAALVSPLISVEFTMTVTSLSDGDGPPEAAVLVAPTVPPPDSTNPVLPTELKELTIVVAEGCGVGVAPPEAAVLVAPLVPPELMITVSVENVDVVVAREPLPGPPDPPPALPPAELPLKSVPGSAVGPPDAAPPVNEFAV